MPATRTLARTDPTISRLAGLGAELARLSWETRLITGSGVLPALLIRDTTPGASAVADHIYAMEMGRRSFYWWSRSCGADPADAAAIITRVLQRAR